MEQNNAFLPEGYETPQSVSNYMKLKDGENKFRIMSKPIIGWLDWQDKKPLRFPIDKKPEVPIDPLKQIRHFWAMVVWNYELSSIQILDITQKNIQKSIKALALDQDWGDPLAYDLKVIKSGQKLETEYKVNPVPHKPITNEMQEAFFDKPINLNALFSGADPFLKQPHGNGN